MAWTGETTEWLSHLEQAPSTPRRGEKRNPNDLASSSSARSGQTFTPSFVPATPDLTDVKFRRRLSVSNEDEDDSEDRPSTPPPLPAAQGGSPPSVKAVHRVVKRRNSLEFSSRISSIRATGGVNKKQRNPRRSLLGDFSVGAKVDEQRSAVEAFLDRVEAAAACRA
ncbi:hypothetical protein HKI87_01g09420 [Chloropicon roscoffensis]|uniref:Uncharacterized protein n=1 Tax=Chloropicon roscoffensis TaxID=1461544 RepID=A0A7S3CD69_9CHLO